MNPLLAQMKRLGLSEPEVLNELNDAGLISDQCVRLWDIPEPDLTRAVGWLKTKRIQWGDGENCNVKVLR